MKKYYVDLALGAALATFFFPFLETRFLAFLALRLERFFFIKGAMLKLEIWLLFCKRLEYFNYIQIFVTWFSKNLLVMGAKFDGGKI